MNCELCKGTHHVATQTGYRRCTCFSTTVASHRVAQLPSHMREVGLDDLLTKSKQLAEPVEYIKRVIQRLQSSEFPKKHVLISGGFDKDLLIAATIRDAALAGVEADRASLSTLTDSYFAQDKSEWKAALKTPPQLLILQMGGEIPNSATTPVLRELISERRWCGGYTFVTLDTTVATMAKNQRTPKDLTDYLSSELTFKEVSAK